MKKNRTQLCVSSAWVPFATTSSTVADPNNPVDHLEQQTKTKKKQKTKKTYTLLNRKSLPGTLYGFKILVHEKGEEMERC